LSPAELAAAFERVPELATAAGPEAASAVAAARDEAPGSAAATAALRAAFGALMSLDAAAAAAAVSLAVARLRSSSAASAAAGSAPPADPRDALLLRLHAQYGGDVGVLAASMLNYVTLAPGEAVALAANEPHAYLAGECVEVMATSDNVVRAGLTPKLRDVATLLSMLAYTQGAPRILRGAAEGPGACVRAYAPGFEEFALDAAEVPAGAAALLRPSGGASVLLVMAGTGEAVRTTDGGDDVAAPLAPGAAWLLPPGARVTLRAGADAQLRAFRARVADASAPA
jgi:mannose-6-phosphate isomerase